MAKLVGTACGKTHPNLYSNGDGIDGQRVAKLTLTLTLTAAVPIVSACCTTNPNPNPKSPPRTADNKFVQMVCNAPEVGTPTILNCRPTKKSV